mgnify:CR=1 FL=1
MRVLHTSDWHLGKSLAGISRQPEHEAFCAEVVDLCEQSDVDVVLLTGDVFDTYNPPIAAEELFFDTLARLGDGGRRAVVVIAGNHDSPDRLTTAVPLAARHGVWILGHPGDAPAPQRLHREGRVQLVGGGPNALHLGLPSGEEVVIAALPYPSEARFRRQLTSSLDEHERQQAYSTYVGELLEEPLHAAPPHAFRLAASHLAVRSCMPSESERVLVGGAYQIDGRHLPASAQYTALGHLHLAQQIPDAPAHAAYAGAPLAFRMSERDHDRAHRLVSLADPRAEPELEAIPIEAGRPLVVWEAEGVEEVVEGVEAGLHEGAIIELRLAVDRRLDHAAMARLQKLPRSFLRIRVDLPEARLEQVPPEVRHQLPPSELFQAFYREQTGLEPDPEVVALFVELLGPDAPATAPGRAASPHASAP